MTRARIFFPLVAAALLAAVGAGCVDTPASSPSSAKAKTAPAKASAKAPTPAATPAPVLVAVEVMGSPKIKKEIDAAVAPLIGKPYTAENEEKVDKAIREALAKSSPIVNVRYFEQRVQGGVKLVVPLSQ